MGLAASQARFLTLTRRKGDVECKIAIDTMRKTRLTNEQTELSQEYYSKLRSAEISFYANGQYNKMNYNYLMGYGNYSAILEGNVPLKQENSMILTDCLGQVVLNKSYANAIKNVLGSSCMNGYGRGGTFSIDKVPEILAEVCTGFTADDFKTVIDGNNASESSYKGTEYNLYSEESGDSVTVDNTDTRTAMIQKLVDFYFPIFSAAASNGWTMEYCDEIAQNEDYISDALLTGFLQLAKVNDEGAYDPDASLSYFTTAGLVSKRESSDEREAINAWYEAEKSRVGEKEDYLDIEIRNLSTELEAINTEMKSIKSLIDDAIQSVFSWGTSA